MNINQKHVKKDGNLVIAIENKMGMKYWAGCAEDHLSQFFAGIEDYPDGGAVRTFTRGGLEKLLHKCGIPDYHFIIPIRTINLRIPSIRTGVCPRWES